MDGEFEYSPSEAGRLSLRGLLDEKDHHMESRYDIILGTTSDAKPITLFSCFQTGVQHSYGDVDTDTPKDVTSSRFIVNYALVGKHFLSRDEIKFKQIFVEFSNLIDWAGSPRIHFDIEKLLNGNEPA